MSLIESDWYQARWPLALREDTRSKGLYVNEYGGFRRSTTIRGGATGFHVDMAIVDDPQKPLSLEGTDLEEESAEAETARLFFDGTLPTRASDHSTFAKLVLMQRLSESDLTGHIQEGSEVWTHLCLPFRYEVDRHCSTVVGEDHRTQEGEILAPNRFPPEAVTSLMDGLRNNHRYISAQLQQNPSPARGGIFQVEHFPIYEDLKGETGIVDIVWDLANSKEGPSWNVGWALLRNGRNYFLIAEERFKDEFARAVERMWDFDARVAAICKQNKWHRGRCIIEEKASGPSAISVLGDRSKGQRPNFAIEGFNPGKDSKLQRAEAITPITRERRVSFPKWFQGLDEIVRFPGKKDKDRVDCLSSYLLTVAEAPRSTSRFLSDITSKVAKQNST